MILFIKDDEFASSRLIITLDSSLLLVRHEKGIYRNGDSEEVLSESSVVVHTKAKIGRRNSNRIVDT